MRRSQVRSPFPTATNRKGDRTLYLPYKITFLIPHEGLTTMRDSSRSNFERNLAVFIGINNYQNGIYKLSTAVNDATALADTLETEYQYQEVIRLFPPHGEAAVKNLKELLSETLPNQVKPTEGDRLIFYFAGHGIAHNSEDGPAGYFITQDAPLGKLEAFLPMRDLNTALSQLECHHLLGMLYCSYAGKISLVK